MLSYSTWRATARIPWVRENLSGGRFLRETLYLMIALYRVRRFRDFLWVLHVFLDMAHSLAQYRPSEARETVGRLLEIPWFAERRRHLLGMIAAYNRVVKAVGLREGLSAEVSRKLRRARGDVEAFIGELKVVIGFDETDEARIRALTESPETLDRRLRALMDSVAA